MTAFGLRSVDGTGDGIDRAAGFGGHAGSDEGAGAARAFGDEEGGRPVGDDAVALGEGLLVGWAAEGKLGDHGAMAVGDALGELAVLGRVDVEKPGTEDGDGASAGIKGGEMGFGIDAESKAGDDGVAGAGEPGGEGAGDASSIMSAAAGADDADGVLIGGGDFSFHVEKEGGVMAFGEVAGPKGRLGGEDGDIVALAEGEFGLGVGEPLPIGDDGRDFGANSGDRLEGPGGLAKDGLGISEFGEETADSDGADLGEGVEGKEGGEHRRLGDWEIGRSWIYL